MTTSTRPTAPPLPPRAVLGADCAICGAVACLTPAGRLDMVHDFALHAAPRGTRHDRTVAPPEVFAAAMASLAAAFRQRLGPTDLATYRRALSDLDAVQLRAAIDEACRRETRFPAPATIRQYAPRPEP